MESDSEIGRACKPFNANECRDPIKHFANPALSFQWCIAGTRLGHPDQTVTSPEKARTAELADLSMLLDFKFILLTNLHDLYAV